MYRVMIKLILALLLVSCGDNHVAGTNSETDTAFAKVSGKVVGLSGLPVVGCHVQILPNRYNPRNPQINADLLSETTDFRGEFSIRGLAKGAYVITARDGSSGFISTSQINIVDDKDADWQTQLKAPSSIHTLISLRYVRSEAYVYVPGTQFQADIDSLGQAQLQGLAEGRVDVMVAYKSGTVDSIEAPIFPSVDLKTGDSIMLTSTGGYAPAVSKHIQPNVNLQAALDGLLAGDSLFLGGGRWELKGVVIACKGTTALPIYIGAEVGETPVLQGISPDHNLIEFNGAAYVIVQGLEIDTTVLGSDAFKFTQFKSSHHITLFGNHIHHVGGIAINSEGFHSNILIDSNHIHHTFGGPGVGIRVSGGAESSDWTIQGNWIHDLGVNTPEQGYAIELTRGIRTMVVRDNVIHDVTEAGIIVWGTALSSPQISDMTRIEGNAIWGVPEALGLYGDVIAKNNVVFNCGNAIYSSNRTGRTRWNVYAIHNTIYGCDEVRLNAWTDSSNTLFANNAVYELGMGFIAPEGSFIYGNIGTVVKTGFTAGTAALDFRQPSALDFFPLENSALVGKAIAPDTSRTDFLGMPRDTMPDVGAYEYRANISGSTIQIPGFKQKNK